ncbi:TPA: helix-turn-helix domain-containing protein [Klebsiella variicola subsp. variicola]|uniref:helix-turn-helix domain-containing protein n=1 Tax=Klebsiella pneumoniae TaxID=573 RepID=UPI0007CBA6F3|nr:helix-turn-helix domain-containing protein [Klebsiella pneumoniae]SBM15605.1 DNA-binding protein [Klebsiella pneumoniae]HBQ5895015.1 helix-turn-helix domain-containing protein [Klebsiella variicola subsp. variicola]HBR4272324.1 helix-turn-helix domain-containing protein [Klebsiella pneumoniae]
MLSDRLTKVLKTRKMSKSELARRVGVTPQAVNNWFSRGELGRESAQQIADVLKISIDWLLNGDPNDILTIEQVRMKRLKQYVENGSLKIEDDPFFEEILSGKKPINDNVARRIERDFSLPFGSLDYDPERAPSNLVGDLSSAEIELVHLFRQMPKSAQKEMLLLFNSRVSEYSSLFRELLELKEQK